MLVKKSEFGMDHLVKLGRPHGVGSSSGITGMKLKLASTPYSAGPIRSESSKKKGGTIHLYMLKYLDSCKAAAKRKFKVWPSAYASGWGVRCTKAGGPSNFGNGKK